MAAKKLKFLLVAHLVGMSFNPAQPSGIKLQRAGKRPILITLAPADAAKDPFGSQGGLDCKLLRRYSVSNEQFEFMDRLNSRVFTPYSGMKISLPHVGTRTRRELIARDGTLAEGYRLPLKHYPDDLKMIIKKASEELTTETLRFLKQIMWFFNLSHLNDPMRYVSLYCNAQGADYHFVNYPETSVGNRWQNDIIWRDGNIDGFVSLWKSASEEPLGHELLREAGSMLHTAPRSALLMLASALEVAVKSYISNRAPVTQWLLTELPSPPVPKILRKFVPALKPVQAVSLANWSGLKSMFRRIDDLVDARNRLTHRGELTITADQLFEFKDDVSDLLFIFDYLNGEQWAINKVRRQTCSALCWPVPSQTLGQIRIMVSRLEE
jgi:hypothetical protein